jgi:hypothetical protein
LIRWQHDTLGGDAPDHQDALVVSIAMASFLPGYSLFVRTALIMQMTAPGSEQQLDDSLKPNTLAGHLASATLFQIGSSYPWEGSP